jgi:hypothetical protein
VRSEDIFTVGNYAFRQWDCTLAIGPDMIEAERS